MLLNDDIVYLSVRDAMDIGRAYDGQTWASGSMIDLSATIIVGHELRVGDELYYKKKTGGFPTAEISLVPSAGYTKCIIESISHGKNSTAYIEAQ